MSFQVQKEIPVVKTVEIPKPYEVVKHVPVLKEVEKLETPEQPTPQKLPFITIQKYKQIPLPSFANVKELFHHHQYETAPETLPEAPVESQVPEHKVHQVSW